MRMPFGKFKGRHCHEIPRYYLRWLLATMDLSPDLRQACTMGLEKMEWNPPTPPDLDNLVHEVCCEWGD
jgi:Putative quorum-sensing-regulated virulence factor